MDSTSCSFYLVNVFPGLIVPCGSGVICSCADGTFPALCHTAANNTVINKEYCKGKEEESDSIGDLLLKQLY